MENANLGKAEMPRNPGENANFISYILFWYVMPVFRKSRKKEIGMEDLYSVLKVHKSDGLGDQMCDAWEREVIRAKKKDKEPSLLRATLSVFGWKLTFIGIILAVIEFLLRMPRPVLVGGLVLYFSAKNRPVDEEPLSQPIFLGGLISYYSNPEDSDINTAYLFAGAVVLVSALNVLASHSLMLSTMHLGMRIRLAMCSMIYRKALRMSKNALGVTTVGQVVNLLSNDVGRLDLSVLFIHYLWLGPLETVVATYFMYQLIGVSAIWGVLFLLAFIPMQGYLGRKTSVWRYKTAQRTDERVRLMNEIIQGIQVIKMYAWEKPFGKVVEWARKKELRVIRLVSYIRGILLSFIIFTTRVSIFISLVAYALSGEWVTAQKAFVITSYYNILRQTMAVFFPQGIGQLAETLVSLKRIQKYMMYDEVDLHALPNSETTTTELGNPTTEVNQKSTENLRYIDSTESIADSNSLLSTPAILGKELTARWDEKSTENTLDAVNIRVQPGSLVAVIGRVGAGKSSLIQVILKELPLISGDIQINGELSYASQEPWLFSASVRQNILFGLPMNKPRYREVVKRCALEKDFSLLEHGDKTIVGERGTSLSGGQKARVSLARACYREAAIYLLDDPLSAVDAHVGRHLFDQCMRTFLRGKTIILVTHQLQYLQNADQIIILDKGRVVDVGTYDSLRDSGLDFAKMLTQNGSDEEGEMNDETAGSGMDGGERRSRAGSKTSTRQRRISDSSIESLEDKEASPKQVEEQRREGSITWEVYRKYIGAMGGICAFFWMTVFFVTTQLAASGGDYFLTYWSRKEDERGLRDSLSNETVVETDEERSARYLDVYIFTGLTVATVFITLFRSFLFFTLAVKASRGLHNAMYEGVTRASMYFFNTNPSGRILNRFSKDMGQVDEILPAVMIDVIQIFLSLAGIVLVVAVVNPYFMIPTVLIGIIFYFLRKFYLLSSRNIKRMEATTRSPIYSHLGASLNGLSTIRAFQAQPILMKEFDSLQDLNSSAFYLFMTTSRAFGFWLDVFSVIYIAIVTLSFFLMDDVIGGNVGLAITQAMGLTGMVQWGMRQSAELENTMTAVERVVEYQTVDPEKDQIDEPQKPIPENWLRSGRIQFVDVVQRYEPDVNAKPVLKGLNFTIEPKEKIGIVGRTGAGKSSLINALFRLSYLEGKILIDDHNTKEISLESLRSCVAIIPQEPVLFSGTMRYNLDPFDEFPDEKLWSALKDVHLHAAISEMLAGLQSNISEGGSNFSVGQRQLVCLARAILRENRILVMDEATANVDPITDSLIQATIREKFSECTVLTIAHRLGTVIDADRVLVMDAGQAVEFDTPYNLLKAEQGPKIFQSMVKETGKGLYDQIVQQEEAKMGRAKKE